ncbi:MAG: hypothetical protein AAGN35_24870 [Bacteroidota bacterium]
MKDPHQHKLIEAASRLGIEVEDFAERWGMDAVFYRFKGKSALVIDGRIYPGLTHQTDLLIENKFATKQLLQELAIPVPADHVFRLPAEEDAEPSEKFDLEGELRQLYRDGQTYVCKPLYGTDGDGVGMHLQSLDAIIAHIEAWQEDYATWMLEEQVAGQDLRIQVIGGELVAACVREPAFVTGDGAHTLDELIAQHNEKIHAQNPKNHLVMDGATRNLLRQQDVFLSSVIEADRKIVLKQVSNMGQGGIARDITDQLHPQYHAWMRAVAERFQLRTFAFDALSTDPSGDPREHTQVIELNAKAQWMHHTFSEGRQHDIPALVLREILDF